MPLALALAKGKGEKERYNHLNAEFQRIARRDKKAFLHDQCGKKKKRKTIEWERLEISTLAWKILWTEEPGRLESMG